MAGVMARLLDLFRRRKRRPIIEPLTYAGYGPTVYPPGWQGPREPVEVMSKQKEILWQVRPQDGEAGQEQRSRRSQL